MVAPGMILGEIENDKVTMEFESFCSGRLLSHCGLKQDLQVGDEICKIEGVQDNEPQAGLYNLTK